MSLKTSGQVPLPQPFFGCEYQSCAEEVSYPAHELTFWQGDEEYDPGWYCMDCLEATNADINADTGPPLSECIVVLDKRVLKEE